MAITRPRGTNDFLPEDTKSWQAVEAMLRQICREFAFEEIRTPIFEDTDLFIRGVGNTTDIVQKEMYTFTDRGERSLTLRPENTASVCRAYLEDKLYGRIQPVKLYYMGPMFRYERPQAGRFRQFHQFGVEVIGTISPYADAEIISLAWEFYNRLGIRNLRLYLNSVGCPNCRPRYREVLQDYFRPHLDQLCPSCQERFERNPLRILDCKSEICQNIGKEAPQIFDNLCDSCADHFEQVKRILATAGVEYMLNPRMVRGLDYYTKTAFEIVVENIGAQSAVCGGGRYDGLIEELGGEPTPSVGFALGMERIFSALKAQGDDIEVEDDCSVFVISTPDNEETRKAAFALCYDLRRLDIKTELDYDGKSIKAQLKAANRINAEYTVIIGSEELADGQAIVKCMKDGEQIKLPIADVKQYLLER